MAALSPIPLPQDKHTTSPEAGLPNWKIGILEKKRRAKEVELLMREEENLKQKFIPEWKRELIKRTRSSQKVPVFKMASPPLPSSPPPSPIQQQDYPPLPPWIREKLSKVANQLKPEQQNTQTSDTDSQNLPHVVQEIVHKFSAIPSPLPSPSAVTSHHSHHIPEVSYDHNLMDDSSLANLPDWKRSIIVRRRRGQVLKRLSLTKDDLDLISSMSRSAAKSTPDKVDIQLQDMSDKRELNEREFELKKTQENLIIDSTIDKSNKHNKSISAGIPRSLFVTQEPQMKVKELLDKFAPIPNMPPSVMLSPSVPKSMKIAKRPPPPPPPPTTPTKQAVTSSPVRNKTEAPNSLPLSPEVILTVEEYNRHHALLVQALASQISPSMVNGNEDMFNFIIPETTSSKRPRTLSPDTPISSVDPYTRVTEISQPLFLPPSKYEHTPLDVPVISQNNEKPIDVSLEEVTLSYIDEVSDDSVVPIHRPVSPDQVPPVPWRDTLDKIKSKRKERVPSDIYENVVIVSTHEVPVLKSSLKAPGVRSQRGRIHFSDKHPSVYQYPKVESVEEGFGNINSFLANQEELSHRLHPSISSARQTQADKLQNYTPAILDYFDSLVSTPAQPVWMQGEQDEEKSPSRDESDEVIDSFTAVPVDFEEELDMSNLSDRAAAMIW